VDASREAKGSLLLADVLALVALAVDALAAEAVPVPRVLEE
jgi:hypothetical protein